MPEGLDVQHVENLLDVVVVLVHVRSSCDDDKFLYTKVSFKISIIVLSNKIMKILKISSYN